MFICFLVAAITFKLSKGTLEFVATCLVLSIQYGSHATIITPYVYKDSLVVIETI